MACLMNGNGLLLFLCHDLGLFLKAADYTVYGIEEVLLVYSLLLVTCCNECCLVADICNICTRESRCLTCENINVYRWVELQRTQVYSEHSLALIEVWQVDMYLSVETSCAQQSFVQDVGAVCSCYDNDSAVGSETIHLGKQLVKCVLSFVIAAHRWVFATCTAYCVNLINEYDAWRLLLCLAEQVADTRCAHADKHLYEVRTRH